MMDWIISDQCQFHFDIDTLFYKQLLYKQIYAEISKNVSKL